MEVGNRVVGFICVYTVVRVVTILEVPVRRFCEVGKQKLYQMKLTEIGVFSVLFLAWLS